VSEKEGKELDSKNYIGLDFDGMPLTDQWQMESELRKYKFQIKIRLRNGRIRYLHANSKKVVEAYTKGIRATIVWVREL